MQLYCSETIPPVVSDTIQDRLFPQPDVIDRIRPGFKLGRRQVFYLLLAVLVLTLLLLIPGINVYLGNQQLQKVAADRSDQLDFMTVCHMDRPDGVNYEHHCNDESFDYLLRELKEGDVILMHFAFDPAFAVVDNDDNPVFNPRLTIVLQTPPVYTSLVLGIRDGSYTHTVLDAGDYGLYFDLNPSSYPQSKYNEPNHYSLEVVMDIALNPKLAAYPLITRLSFVPLVLLLSVLLLRVVKSRYRW